MTTIITISREDTCQHGTDIEPAHTVTIDGDATINCDERYKRFREWSSAGISRDGQTITVVREFGLCAVGERACLGTRSVERFTYDNANQETLL